MTSGPTREPGDGFVGRSAELVIVTEAVTAARAGAPSVVLIGGDAGMGKSTLVSVAAGATGARLVVGRCVRLGSDVVPLGPLLDLLRHVQRVAPGSIAATDGLDRFAPWLTARGTGAAADRASADGVFAPVLELLGRLAADDVAVVAFEDLHWADDTTWDLFELLARNLYDEHLVLIGTYRSDEVARDPAVRRRVAELARLGWVRRIELAGLGRDDVARRVAQLSGGTSDAAVVDDVLARGEGNPFFTEELVRAHLSGEVVPGVVSDLIAADLEVLDPEARAVVDVAAAIGREVSHELLADVVAVDDLALESALRSAIGAQVLAVDRDADGYRFRHALIAEVVYDELLPSHRRRLHRRIADVLRVASDPGPSADHAAQLAFHLDRAGDVPGAFAALLAAADASQAVAPAVALRQLDRAFELWDDADGGSAQERCERLWQAAELATGAVGNDRAVVLAREAFRWGMPARGAAWAHERLGRYLWASGEIDASRPEFVAAAELVETEPPTEGTASAMAGLAQAALMDGDPAGAERWCRAVLDRVQQPAADPAAWVMAARVLGVVRAETADLVAAVQHGRAALASAPTAYARAMAAAYLGIVLVEAGDYPEAVAVAIDGGGDARLAGLDRSFGAYFDSEAVEGLMRIGQWDDANALVERREASGIDGFHPGRTRMLVTAAVLAARRGDPERAGALLDRAGAGPIDAFHRPLLDAGTAEVHLASGEWTLALAAADAGWEASGDRPWWAVRFAMLSVTASVERTLDAVASRSAVDVGAEAARLEHRVETAAALVHGRPAPLIDVELLHARAMLSLLTRAAVPLWGDVAARWEALPDRWMEGDARIREAEAWSASGDAARTASALRAAHVIALELSSTTLLARVEAVSRRTRISVESAELVVIDERSADRLGLTPREAEVLGLVTAGRTNKQIGAALYVSEKTASVHVSNILRKLGVTTRVEAAAVAQRLGLG